MSEIKEKEFKREPGSCVIHDDNHGWGGPETEEVEKTLKLMPEIKEKIKKTMVADEPLNWPFYHQSK